MVEDGEHTPNGRRPSEESDRPAVDGANSRDDLTRATVTELARMAASEPELDRLVEGAVERLLTALDASACEVWEVEGEFVRLRWGAGWDDLDDLIPIGPESHPGFTLLSREALLLEDVDRDTSREATRALRQRGVISGVCVHIPGESEPVGVLGVYRRERRNFGRGDVELLRTVAHLVGAKMAAVRTRDALAASQARLRQVQKMEVIGQLAGGIAHDFNNLLTAIMSYASVGRLGLADDDPLAADLDGICRAAQQAAALTRQVLTFSRKQAFDRRDVDVNSLIQGQLRLLGRVLGAHIEIAFQAQPDLSNVHADPGQLEQVVLNLCVNARDAMPDGGRLTLRTQEIERADLQSRPSHRGAERYVRIQIADTGVGIPPKMRERIFEPFFTTKEEGHGTGIGLATVDGIVQQHGGWIEVQSELGEGTAFCVFLPASEGGESGFEDRPDTGRIEGGELVLVAEDNEHVRRLAVRILKGYGYRTLEAADGVEAVKLFRENAESVSLLVLDVVMPHLNGPGALEEIRQLNPRINYLFTSGYTGKALGPNPKDFDTLRWLAKPYDSKTLLSKVRKVLDQA